MRWEMGDERLEGDDEIGERLDMTRWRDENGEREEQEEQGESVFLVSVCMGLFVGCCDVCLK